MTDIFVDIEHSIPQQEFFKFKQLAELMDKDLKDVVELCMYERRDELIDTFTNNVPTENTSSNSTNDFKRAVSSNSTNRTETRTKEKVIPDTSS